MGPGRAHHFGHGFPTVSYTPGSQAVLSIDDAFGYTLRNEARTQEDRLTNCGTSGRVDFSHQ